MFCHSGFEQITSFLRLSFLACTMGLKRAVTSQGHRTDRLRCCMSEVEPSAGHMVSSGCWKLGYHRACRIPQPGLPGPLLTWQDNTAAPHFCYDRLSSTSSVSALSNFDSCLCPISTPCSSIWKVTPLSRIKVGELRIEAKGVGSGTRLICVQSLFSCLILATSLTSETQCPHL